MWEVRWDSKKHTFQFLLSIKHWTAKISNKLVGKVQRQRNCSVKYIWKCSEWPSSELSLILLAYLSLREEGASEPSQAATGLRKLLKLIFDMVLTRTGNSLMGSRQQDMFGKNKFIFVVTRLGNIRFHVAVWSRRWRKRERVVLISVCFLGKWKACGGTLRRTCKYIYILFSYTQKTITFSVQLKTAATF